MIHHISHRPSESPTIRQTTRQQSQETAIAPDLILRRTTIEEIEFKPQPPASESR